MENTKINIKIDIILFIIFLILKLDGIINWKWIWVFSPFWTTWIVQLCFVAIMAIGNWKPKYKTNMSYGAPLVWDSKTNTMYGPFESEN